MAASIEAVILTLKGPSVFHQFRTQKEITDNENNNCNSHQKLPSKQNIKNSVGYKRKSFVYMTVQNLIQNNKYKIRSI